MWRPVWLTTDRVVGCAFCMLALALVTIITPNQIAAPKFTLGSGTAVKLSPGFFPNMLATVIGLLGLLLAARGRTKEDSLLVGEGFALNAEQWAGTAKISAILFSYLLALPFFGFLITTPLCLVILMLQLGSRRWILMAVIALATTAVVHVVFRHGMQVLMPEASLLAF